MTSGLWKSRNIGLIIGSAIVLSLCGSARAQTTCFGVPAGDPGVCSGHGVCIAPDTCSCYVGYSGVQCQTATCFGLPDTDPAVCSGHGVCIAANTCSCQVGFTGDECASLVIPTVTVGNPGNAPDTQYETPGYGGVDYVYRIGKFEVTAGQYAEFLNAVAETDTYGLYNPSMDSDPYGCQITRHGASGSYWYDFSGGTVEAPGSTAADWADRPAGYVDWGDAARFCNWLHNGQPTGAQDLSTTEDGSYYLNGAVTNEALIAVVREPDATWVIPSEHEWYKAAYHKNDGVMAHYWDYPTNSNSVGYVNDSGNLSGTGTPFTEGGTDPGNYATYDGDGGTDGIGSPYYRTEVGEWEDSASPYGTFDQGGNHWEWNEAVIDSWRANRGGSIDWIAIRLHRMDRPSSAPAHADVDVGFRVAEVSPNIPAVSEWGVVTMTLLVLTAGTVVLVRRRVSPIAG